jgi:hypothetical protein
MLCFTATVNDVSMYIRYQCCGTVMIYCGSGFYFGKVPAAVSAPVPAPVPIPVPDPDLFGSFSTKTKNVQNIAFSMIEQHCFSESWPLIFDFFTIVLHFMLDPGPNPVLESEADPEPECITVLVALRQKVVVTAVPVPQHWYTGLNDVNEAR